ncbi:MAG: CopG family antitoxin [Pyrinomonadaceae bacterium]
MTENNSKRLPKFESLDALVDFFDQNDLGDYLEQMPEAKFEMDLKKRSYLVAVDEEIGRRLAEISRREHLPSDTLVNSWLREKILDYSEKR